MSIALILLLPGQTEEKTPDRRKRALSAAGRLQAGYRRRELGSPAFDLVIHSSFAASRETALIISGFGEKAATVEVPELYFKQADPLTRAVE
ncbi:MAG: hypothetical protein QOG91_376, partial [Candidatus Parcubacteria bacterium]|nr:hypothetical protein [Candidatus Parcubacteria bacterium]